MPAALLRLFLVLLCLAWGPIPGLGKQRIERTSQVHKSAMISTSVQIKRLVQPFDATLYSGFSSNEVIKKLM